MKSTVETLSPTRVRLAVEVPFDELRPSLDRAYKSIAGQVRIPGFRPGKAPARIIDQRIGRAAVLQEAVQDAIPKAYAEAISSNELRALGQPDFELTKLEDGAAIEFTAEVDVRPEITLPDLSTLSVTVDSAEVSDEDVANELSALRERFAVLKSADRPAQHGDYVSIDLLATVDGAEVEGGSTTGLSYEIGSGDLLPGIDEALAGMSTGESRTFTTQLVAGDHGGEDAEVTVTVRSVKVKELPELDDEFAEIASEFDTLDELRADVRDRLTQMAGFTQVLSARQKVVEALLAAVDVPLPESVVDGEVEWRQTSVARQLEGAGLEMSDYLEREGQTREEFDTSLRDNATTAVKSQLVLDAVADAEQLGVSETDLTQHIIRQARQYGMAPQEFAKQMSEAGSLPALVAEVRRDKAVQAVLEAATVTDEAGQPIDVSVLRPTAAENVEEDVVEGVEDADGDAEDGSDGATDVPAEAPATGQSTAASGAADPSDAGRHGDPVAGDTRGA